MEKNERLELLAAKLRAIDEESVGIKIPGRRYDAIEEAVLEMYLKADIHEIPVPMQAIADAFDYEVCSYQMAGGELEETLLQCSPDATTVQYPSHERVTIFYNAGQPLLRQRFSFFHEVGHLILGHKEESALAEKEANHFAATALCPLPLLEHHRISDVESIVQVFEISKDCATNRVHALENQRNVRSSIANVKFRGEVIKQFTIFKNSIQTDLFLSYGN